MFAADDVAMTLARPLLLVTSITLVALIAVACSSSPSATPGTTSSTTTPSTPTAPRDTTVRPAVTPRAKTVHATLRTPDGRDRTYHVYAPSNVTPGATSGPAVPLLLALHGGGGSGLQFERTSGFDGLAEANGFVVVYPDGIGGGPNRAVLRTWNGGRCCGAAARTGVDDVGFVRLLVAKLETQYPIDRSRVYVAGHSNGGMLAYRLACELSDEIAAVGVQSTSLESDVCRPAKPVSLLHIHGTADRNVPIDGGRGPNAISGVDYAPPIDGVRTVARLDGCQADPVVTKDADNPDVTVQRWEECDAGVEVVFMTVNGAPHAWMGHTPPRNGTRAYEKLDSSLTIWTFLAAHARS